MPVLFLLAFITVLILLTIALTPLMLIQRYRVGTSRQRARNWLLTLNVIGFSFSSVLFLVTAGVTSLWVREALPYSLLGFFGGCLLGIVGLALSTYEIQAGALHFTPNRWLVLAITLVVTARLAFGFWRSWQVWGLAPDYASWAAEAGVAGSLGAGAVVLGYYVTYWTGVRRRLRRAIPGATRR